MANNRLYLVDPATGDRFCIAKSMGDGWYVQPMNEGEDFVTKLNEWFDHIDSDTGLPRDFRASIGGSRTTFVLEDES